MRYKHLILPLLIFIPLLFSISALGASESDYKVKENHLYVFEITKLNNELTNETFIYNTLGPDAEIGAMIAHMVTNISFVEDEEILIFINGSWESVIQDTWTIEFWYRDRWTTDLDQLEDPSHEPEHYYHDSSFVLYERSDKYYFTGRDIMHYLMYIGTPTPVENWLEMINFKQLYGLTSMVDGKSLIAEYDSRFFSQYDDNFTEVLSFNSNGEFESRSALTMDDEIIFEIQMKTDFSDSIIGFDLHLTIVSITSVVSLSILILRKKTSK